MKQSNSQEQQQDSEKRVDKLTVSFMRSLCMGIIEQQIISPFPEMKREESETLKSMFSTINPWLKKHEGDFRKWDRQGELPPELIQEMRDLGLFSLIIPEEHGGLGLSSTGYSRALQELTKHDGSVAITAGAHSSIGMRGLVLFGTKEQKEKYLPKLASGELIAAFCLTEPGAGSDAASIKTKATREGDQWILSGEKLWITNGGIGDFFTVFARTDGPEGHITAFIVTRDMVGVTNGPHEDKMGLRASSTTTVFFDKVKIPAENVLGEVGKGFKVAMNILNSGRTGLGGGCIGVMKHLIELSTKQANERSQFGQKIAEYGLIKQKIGHMVVDCYATEAIVSMVAGLVDQGHKEYAVEAAISKVFATECLWRSADEALQIAGGNGYMCEFPYERIVRDSRVNRIFEGTNDILRLFIALTAMHDVGKNLKELSTSIESIFQDPIKGFGLLSEYTKRRFSHATGVGGKNATLKVHKRIQVQATLFEDSVRDLAIAADRILRKHGKNIIGKQFATKRLADIMIDLFVLACVISRVNNSIQKKGETEATKEIEILQIFARQATGRAKKNFAKIDDNDDEIIKDIATHALHHEGYIWDNL